MKQPRQHIRKLVSEEELARRIHELGSTIARDYHGKEICVVAILKGSVVFLADLLRAIEDGVTAVHFEFIDVTRRGGGSDDEILDIHFVTHFSLEGKNILLLKDVMNTGVIENYLVSQFKMHNPNDVKIAALINKPKDRKVELDPNYFAFELPDGTYVGYGLEYEGLHGNLSYLGVIDG